MVMYSMNDSVARSIQVKKQRIRVKRPMDSIAFAGVT